VDPNEPADVGARGPGPETHPAVRRILTELDDPDLLEELAGLAASDLSSFLLELMRRRVRQIAAPDVLRRYQQDRFVVPAAFPMTALRRVEDAFLAALPEGWDVVTLSPLVPFGTHAATADIAQDRVVSTVRGTEVAADPTNALALEAGARRRSDRAGVVRLAAIQRVVRAQRFEAADAWAHFTLFALLSTGRDRGGRTFEQEAFAEHLAIHVEGALRAGAEGVRVLLTDLTGGDRETVLRVAETALSRTPGVTVERDPEREEGRGYYEEACFKIRGVFGQAEFEISDGGFVPWGRRLLADRRERMCISGSGLDRIAVL
jgi:hypothetical protein